MPWPKHFRIGVLLSLIVALNLFYLPEKTCLAQPPGGESGAGTGTGVGAGAGLGGGPTAEGAGNNGGQSQPQFPAGGKPNMSPEELKALREQELDEERKDVTEHKSRYLSQRHWRGFCLCNSNMFTHAPAEFSEACFTDLFTACYHKGHHIPLEDQAGGIFSYELCSLIATVEEGSISTEFLNTLDFEVKSKCKHPYRIQRLEFFNFMKDVVKVDQIVADIMSERKFDGKQFSELTEERAQYLSLPLNFYTDLMDVRDYLAVSGRTVPYTIGRENASMPSTIEANMQINDVYNINEQDFTFEAAFTLSFAWTDSNSWSECQAEGDDIEEGECQWNWRPEPYWKNARNIEITKRLLYSMAAYKSAFYIIQARGQFSTPMSFKKFPRDWQNLKIEFSLAPSKGSITDTLYENVQFSPVSGSSTIQVEGDHDLISGWWPRGVSAHQEKRVRTSEPTYLFKEAKSTIWAGLEEKVEKLFGPSHLMPVEYESTVVVEISVERVTSYYMLNFTLVVALLTMMSWVSFFLSPEDLNDRATIALTIILALNVFQLIMNDSMPKTGYLTPLTQFIIGSTFFAAFATIESVAVFILHRRTLLREEVVQKFRGSLSTVLPVQNDGNGNLVTAKTEAEDEKGSFQQRAEALKEMLRRERLERFLANHLDPLCITVLPLAYAFMTVILFDFI